MELLGFNYILVIIGDLIKFGDFLGVISVYDVIFFKFFFLIK